MFHTAFLFMMTFCMNLIIAAGALGATDEFTLNIDWKSLRRTVTTAATVEVDVMPHLGRTPHGGPFNGYMSALSNLGSRFVRFSPWYAYPRVVVPELERADCRPNGKGSSWNATLLNGIVSDFMLAVCGPNAINGACEDGLSVVPQLSTMPAWLYTSDGTNRTAIMPNDPWLYPTDKFEYYVVQNQPLLDETCEEMARYAARYVSWFTQGGMTDECGVWHESGLRFKWDYLSVLNEDEYHTPPGGGVIYTVCWDAWKREIGKVHPTMKLVGPETAGGPYGVGRGMRRSQRSAPQSHATKHQLLRGQLDYSLYYLNGSNHDDGLPPEYVSNHVALYGPPWHSFFDGVDEWIDHVAAPLDDARKVLAPEAQLIMNEFIPFNNEWCNSSAAKGATCDWAGNSSMGAAMNRETMGWSAAAASFGYAFGKLSEMGFAWVGADQLIGGVWPDNEPAVASLDWITGEPNAKYWAVRMLARGLGGAPRGLHPTVIGGGPLPPKPGYTAAGNCGDTSYHDDCEAGRAQTGAWNTTTEKIADLAACAERCRKCPETCEYISFSLRNEDCSWYASCNMSSLAPPGAANYTSEAVQPTHDPSRVLYALGMSLSSGAAGHTRKVLLVNKIGETIMVRLAGGGAAIVEVLEGVGSQPGYVPPSVRRTDVGGRFHLGPYAVALLSLDADRREA